MRPHEVRAAHRFIPTGVGNTRPLAPSRGWCPVHPHGRGEHCSARSCQRLAAGSSPRAWGTRCRAAARADQRSVHPHGRGEHQWPHTQSRSTPGSSPRAWGTRARPRRHDDRASVHPHGRGEHARWQCARSRLRGSSPRAWGTRFVPGWRAPRHRFIPTGVGNTILQRRFALPRAVHPHGRGEHQRRRHVGLRDSRFIPTGVGNTWRISSSTSSAFGSSPRAWGTRVENALGEAAGRFIPTGVGNTIDAPAHRAGWGVHPHGRGEHPAARTHRTQSGGSSPRAWGTRPSSIKLWCCMRFIPTGVGNTPRAPRKR